MSIRVKCCRLFTASPQRNFNWLVKNCQLLKNKWKIILQKKFRRDPDQGNISDSFHVGIITQRKKCCCSFHSRVQAVVETTGESMTVDCESYTTALLSGHTSRVFTPTT